MHCSLCTTNINDNVTKRVHELLQILCYYTSLTRGVMLTPHPLLVPGSPYGPYSLYRAPVPVQGYNFFTLYNRNWFPEFYTMGKLKWRLFSQFQWCSFQFWTQNTWTKFFHTQGAQNVKVSCSKILENVFFVCNSLGVKFFNPTLQQSIMITVFNFIFMETGWYLLSVSTQNIITGYGF